MDGNELHKLVEGLPKALGLNGFKLEVMEQVHRGGYSIILNAGSLEVSHRDMAADENTMKNLAAFVDGCVSNTEYVKSLKKRHEEIVKARDGTIKQLDEKIKELQKFKDYYEMQMELNHGRVK